MLQGKLDRTRWISHLRSLTEDAIAEVPFDADGHTKSVYIERFRDEFGNRRASDRAFMAHLLGVDIESERDESEMGLDERLWWIVARGVSLPQGLLAPAEGLLTNPDELAIEYRTMIELGALQAIWSIVIRDRNETLRERALDAARWHIEELQPDNAINRPWGLAVFVELASASDDESVSMTADLHAQTLLHNACINFGRPDLLSALILKDAIEQLRAGV